MRIKAIRGCNLASLAGPFEVDFEAEPLAHAGLVAITGPTGSGKSTLLDALCLALFARVPRLIGVTAEAGDDELRPSDPRTVLRHDEGQGWAEVEFLGRDGASYRARWTVHRARNRADGPLQKATLKLEQVENGQQLGRTLTEVQAAVVDRLGLDFEQFCRAVLLPQGAFENFLKAALPERTALLETLTGTDVFSRLSRAAHEANRAHDQAIHDIRSQLAGLRLLADDERRALADQASSVAERRRRLETQAERLRSAAAWHRRHTELEANARAAAATSETAEATVDAAAEARRLLARAELAQPLRTRWDSAHQARAALDTASAAAAARAQALEAAETRVRAAQATTRLAEQAYTQARAAAEAAEPRLRQADALDQRLATLCCDRDEAAALAGDAQAALQAAQARLATLEADRARAMTAAAAARQWLQTHAPWLPLAQRAATLAQQLDAHQTCRQRLAETEAEHARLASRRDTAAATLTAAATALERAEQACRQAQMDRDLAHDQRQQADALDQAWRPLPEARHALQRLDAIQHQWRDAIADRDRAETALREIQATLATERAALAAASGDLPSRLAQRSLAQQRLRVVALAGDEAAQALRAALVPGEPCPVCGAADHLLTQVDAALQQRLHAAQAEVDGLEQACLSLTQQQSQAQARCEALERRQGELTETLNRSQAQIAEAERHWPPARAVWQGLGLRSQAPFQALALRDLAETPDRGQEAILAQLKAALEDLAPHASRAQAALHEAAQAATAAEATFRSAEARLAQARTTEGQARSTATQAESDAQAAAVALDRLRGEVALRGGDLDRELAGLLPDWAGQTAAAVTAHLNQVAQTLDAMQRQQTEAQAALDQYETAVAPVKDQALRQQTARDAAQARCNQAEAALQRLAAERALLFDGQATATIRDQLGTALRDAEQALEAARTAAAEAGAACAGARRAAEDAATQARTCTEAEQAAARALDAALADRGLTHAEAATLLALGEDHLAAERARLAALDATLREARAVAEDRRQAAAAHGADPARPAEDAATIDASLAALTAEGQTLEQEARRIDGLLQVDDHTRATQARQLAALAQAEDAARVWAQLNALIGSQNGAKFREYAQQITFRHLLQAANDHLRDLSPRYRLQAAGGPLALQVVDGDMGDERRGVHSLSGGERFLVSLALALGLSSMAGEDGRVFESLFIDEGFGTLDRNAVAEAVAALEQLQSTGRRVCLISHVDEIRDRITTRIEVHKLGNGRSRVVVPSLV